MSKHTAGPWKYNGVKTILDDNGFVIVHIPHIFRDGADANARLITAAPELLEALKAVLTGPNLARSWLTPEQYDKVLAAIALASPQESVVGK